MIKYMHPSQDKHIDSVLLSRDLTNIVLKVKLSLILFLCSNISEDTVVSCSVLENSHIIQLASLMANVSLI